MHKSGVDFLGFCATIAAVEAGAQHAVEFTDLTVEEFVALAAVPSAQAPLRSLSAALAAEPREFWGGDSTPIATTPRAGDAGDNGTEESVMSMFQEVIGGAEDVQRFGESSDSDSSAAGLVSVIELAAAAPSAEAAAQVDEQRQERDFWGGDLSPIRSTPRGGATGNTVIKDTETSHGSTAEGSAEESAVMSALSFFDSVGGGAQDADDAAAGSASSEASACAPVDATQAAPSGQLRSPKSTISLGPAELRRHESLTSSVSTASRKGEGFSLPQQKERGGRRRPADDVPAAGASEAATRIQARARGNLARASLRRQRLAVVKLQRATRLWQARRQGAGGLLAQVVDVALARHADWRVVFEAAVDGGPGLDSEAFVEALRFVQPWVAEAQAEVLFSGYCRSQRVEVVDVLGFCSMAEAVATNMERAAEFAGLSPEDFNVF